MKTNSIYRRLLTLGVVLTTHIASYGQQNANCFGTPAQQAFEAGEVLHYNVKYSAAIFSTSVATATVATSSDHIDGVECYKVGAIAKTKPFYNMFFKLEDIYTTWIEKSTLRPLRSTSELKEGDYRARGSFEFDWNKGVVSTVSENLTRKDKHTKQMNLGPCSYDAIALFFNMRQIDTRNLVPNKPINLSLVLEDTVRTITFKFLERDTYYLDDIGEFRTLKFSCRFVSSTDQSFKDGEEFYVWISDDLNKIPVYIESPIRVGKVSVSLQTWANLSHPFSSLIFNSDN